MLIGLIRAGDMRKPDFSFNSIEMVKNSMNKTFLAHAIDLVIKQVKLLTMIQRLSTKPRMETFIRSLVDPEAVEAIN